MSISIILSPLHIPLKFNIHDLLCKQHHFLIFPSNNILSQCSRHSLLIPSIYESAVAALSIQNNIINTAIYGHRRPFVLSPSWWRCGVVRSISIDRVLVVSGCSGCIGVLGLEEVDWLASLLRIHFCQFVDLLLCQSVLRRFTIIPFRC